MIFFGIILIFFVIIMNIIGSSLNIFRSDFFRYYPEFFGIILIFFGFIINIIGNNLNIFRNEFYRYYPEFFLQYLEYFLSTSSENFLYNPTYAKSFIYK
jgi:putative Mn2+ efflux pump MntP